MQFRASYAVFAAITLYGCRPAGVKDAVDSSLGDSGSIDSADTSDLGKDCGELTELSVSFEKDATGDLSRYALTWVDLSSFESEALVFGDTLVDESAPSDHATYCIRLPVTDELQAVDEDSERKIAAFISSVSTYNEEEDVRTFSGVSETWLLYSNLADSSIGLAEGWNFYSPLTESIGALETLHVQSNLNPVDVLSFTGTFTNESAVAPVRMVVLPTSPENMNGEDEPIWDSDLPPEWSVKFEGRPSESHFYFDPDIRAVIAGELPISYNDLNENSEWDMTLDSVGYGTCIGDSAIVTIYFAQPEDLATALTFQMSNLVPGWSILKFGEMEAGESVWVQRAEYGEFWIGKECRWATDPPDEG